MSVEPDLILELRSGWMNRATCIEAAQAIEEQAAEIARLRKGLEVFSTSDTKSPDGYWVWDDPEITGGRWVWIYPEIENPAAFARDVLEGTS